MSGRRRKARDMKSVIWSVVWGFMWLVTLAGLIWNAGVPVWAVVSGFSFFVAFLSAWHVMRLILREQAANHRPSWASRDDADE
jgi:O-antigen/teichoic acid export membrane protein